MAFTTTMLSWSTIEYGKRMGPQMKEARVAIRYAADYFLKCATSTPGRLYNPVSDVAAETAAALAAASIVFRKVDPSYSKLLLRTAQKVYQFALQYQGSYSNSLVSAACPFYCSYSGFKDELLWGAAWLFRAANAVYYYKLVKSLGADDQPDIFSWDNKYAGAHVLLSNRALLNGDKNFDQYRQEADNFMCKVLLNSPPSTTQCTQGGLMFKLPESNLQYVTAITFLLTTYSKYMSATKHTFNCGNVFITTNTCRQANILVQLVHELT
ncbi:Endoglucanase 3 [Lathyrus oleraceus]|uniref:cellulase n=1 Tax=Pisum sativum TaxID=3888 RepID=A0A9D5B6I2_PEA|nr:Endoglucanase 3 [Pisum sativum]